MNDELISELLEELAKTRKSFEVAGNAFQGAIGQIKWNKRNTVIQYALIGVIMCMLIFSGGYYVYQERADCRRGNEFREAISESLDANATAIGVALSVVTEAPEHKFEQYLEIYFQQEKPKALEPRGC